MTQTQRTSPMTDEDYNLAYGERCPNCRAEAVVLAEHSKYKGTSYERCEACEATWTTHYLPTGARAGYVDLDTEEVTDSVPSDDVSHLYQLEGEVPKATWDRLTQILNIEDFEGLTEDEREALDLEEDSELFSQFFKFPDGATAEVLVCTGQTNAWVDYVLTDPKGRQHDSEPDFALTGACTWEVDGRTYSVALVCPEAQTRIKVLFTDIVYDTDGEAVDLPKTLEGEFDADFNIEYEGADYISDQTGWCVFSFNFSVTPTN